MPMLHTCVFLKYETGRGISHFSNISAPLIHTQKTGQLVKTVISNNSVVIHLYDIQPFLLHRVSCILYKHE